MFKAFVLAMLVISCVAAFPTGESISKTLGVTGKNMATCIASKKVTGVVASAKAAAVAAWGKVTSMFGRRLGAIAAVKGAAKKVALVACNTAGNAIVQKAGKKSAGAMWGADSQACAKQLVGDACQKKVTSVLGRRLVSGADMAKALGFKGAEMAKCILARKVSAASKAAGAAWAKVTSIFGRRLGAIAAVKGAAKKVALAACKKAANAVVQKIGSKAAGTMWGKDSQLCAQELTAASCETKVGAVFKL